MAPVIAIPADFARRFPDIAAQLQPREFRGEVTVAGGVLRPDDFAWLDAHDDTRLRRSGVMLPNEDGAVVETLRDDIKSRMDSAPIPTVLVNGSVGRVEEIVARLVWWYGIQYPRLDRSLIAHYGPGDHFAWHRDDMLPAVADRDTAITVGLNDDYEGGLLELPETGLSIKVGRGVGVAFPASALHRVTPITRGVRKVLLTFILKETAP